MARLRLYFSYDGTPYRGFQRQENTPHTVQEVIESKLSMLANARVSILASGRTDAGVHARIQVAHANVPDQVAERPHLEGNFLKALNSLLPHSIRIYLIEKCPSDFHAIAHVSQKTYCYFIDPNPIQMPWLRHQAWHLRLPLNWDAMEEATQYLQGEHDFGSFCAARSTAKTTIRTLYEARWGTVFWQGIGAPCELRVLRLTGSGFLKNMCRIITGTLVHIGNGRASPDLIKRCLETPDRQEAGLTAPAHGLWLWDILYLSH